MNNELVIFETKDNDIKLDVPVDRDTVWLTQAQMTEWMVLMDESRMFR